MGDADSDDFVDKGEEEDPALSAAPSRDIDEGYRTLAHGVLSPRHRRLAQMAAEGRSNKEIGQTLGYVDSRVSVLLKNPHISAEISRLQERIFEETIESRLKTFAEPALANIHEILTDRTNKVKVSEKMALSQWVIEKLDGKATQKIEAGGNLLSALMDRLDASRSAVHHHQHVHVTAPVGPAKDVTHSVSTPQAQIEAAKSEEDLLDVWMMEFDTSSQAK